MKKNLPLIVLAAVAASLFASCAGAATASNEEAAAVMAMSGAQAAQGAGSGPKAMTAKGPGAADSKDLLSYTFTINGPKGGTATYTCSIAEFLSDGIYSGSIAYADYTIEYDGSVYVLNGTYTLKTTYQENSGSFTIKQDSDGAISIVKDGGPAKIFSVHTTSNSKFTYTAGPGGVYSIVLETTVTGTINGESINQRETISFSA